MIMPEPPEPKYWKSLLTMSIFTAPVTWSAVALAHVPAVPAVIVGAVLTVAASYFVYGRMQNDWRATDTMAARTFDAYTGTRMQRGFKRRD